MRIILNHPTDERLPFVIAEMRKRGRPNVTLYHVGADLYVPLGATHRLTAAHRLGIRPRFRIVPRSKWNGTAARERVEGVLLALREDLEPETLREVVLEFAEPRSRRR